jgi:4-hydroxy-3-methylbut-2-enyl diphosphate reductase
MIEKNKKIILAKPRGFCAGVTRAVKTVEKALELFGAPVFVKHQIVHNKRVVNMLKKKGAQFVESLNDIPEGSVTIFSAHGVAPQVKQEAGERNLKTIDATCPLVQKVHLEAKKFHNDGYTVILIGHRGHQEVMGIMGEGQIELIENVNDIESIEAPDSQKVVCLTQTTLSVDDASQIIKELKKKFPDLVLPMQSDICYATQNRQMAVKEIAKDVDIVIVIGSKSSSNSNRLAEVAGGKGYLISDISEIDEELLNEAKNIGITAGASTPNIMVVEVVEFIKNKFTGTEVEEREYKDEDTVFPLPAELGDDNLDFKGRFN